MAAEEMNDIKERGSLYDLNKDGVLSEAELEQAMEREAASWSNRMSTLFSTHPPTYKRIILLKAIEDEMRTSQIGEGQIYRRI
jgi:Zn-dependent protease with chaperone function